MNTVEFIANENRYDLRLDTKNVIKLEKALGRNPLSIFMGVDDGELPTLKDMVTILYYALQPNHSALVKNMDDAYNIYDDYVEGGGSMIQLLPTVLNLFKACGLVPKDIDEEKN